MPEDLLTIEEAADLLGVSPATVKRMCVAGRLDSYKIGRSWVIKADSLRRAPTRPRERVRRPASTSMQLDFDLAVRQLRSYDLRRDLWVPDILNHQDDLADGSRLIAAAADRVDNPLGAFDAPIKIPVPKSPIFPRNATNLTLPDRVAYHATVANFASLIESELTGASYAARLRGDGRRNVWLKNGRNQWIRWKNDIIRAIDQNSWVVEADMTAYFDLIKHEILLPEIQALGVPPNVVNALREMLRTWSSTPNTGLPQGPDASRVLANFYMAPIDTEMLRNAGIAYFRYMDDIRIVAPSKGAAIRALHVLDSECRRRGLALSTQKTLLKRGPSARQDLGDRELDAIQYLFVVVPEDSSELRDKLRQLFQKATETRAFDRRRAGFAIFRLFVLRDQSILVRVLARLEQLATLGWLVPAYLLPWLRRSSVQERVADYLEDEDRNVSPYLSTWLLAALLDLRPGIHPRLFRYARKVALDRDEPAFHRAVALVVFALNGSDRDLARVEEIALREHDPEIIRACMVALARACYHGRRVNDRIAREGSLDQTAAYLRGRNSYPSLIFPGTFVDGQQARRA